MLAAAVIAVMTAVITPVFSAVLAANVTTVLAGVPGRVTARPR